MAFNIVIQADSSQAEQNIGRVGDKLKDIESTATRSGGKLSEALKESGVKAGEAGEKIHGMGVEIEGSLSQSMLGRFGEFGKLLGELTSKGTLAAGGLVALGAEVIHLGDEYIELSNKSLRLAGSFDNVNSTLTRQMEIARQIHGTLGQTIGLSTLVKERTDALGLSTMEQNKLTVELGQASTLSGHAAGDAAQAFGNLGFMLEEHLPAGRQVKQLMMEFPEIADALKEHFHASGEAIVKMAQQGKLSMADFVAAINQHGDAMADKMKSVHETLGETIEHFKDQTTLTIGKVIEESGAIESLGQSFNALSKMIGGAIGPLDAFLEKLGAGKGKGGKLLTGGLLGTILGGEDEDAKLASLSEIVGDMNTKAANGVKQWELYHSNLGKVDDAIHLVAGSLDSLIATKLVDPWKNAAEAMKHHATVLSDEEKLLQSINAPMTKIMANEMNLAKLYGDGAISAGRYATETERLRLELEKLDIAEIKLAAHTMDHTFGGLGSTLVEMGQNAAHALGGAGASVDRAAGSLSAAADKQTIREAAEALKEYDKQVAITKSVLEAGFRPLGNELIKLAETGKFSFSSMADSIISDLLRMEVKWLELKAIGFMTNMISGPSPADQAMNVAQDAGLIGFASGGDFDIPRAAGGLSGTFGGQGGTDSQLAMFRVTPGEHFSIRTPEQMAAQQQQAPVVHVHPAVQVSHDDVLNTFDSPRGEKIVMQMVRRNSAALRSYIGR